MGSGKQVVKRKVDLILGGGFLWFPGESVAAGYVPDQEQEEPTEHPPAKLRRHHEQFTKLVWAPVAHQRLPPRNTKLGS